MATPLQTVNTQFGSKDELVKKLVPLVERNADESDAALSDRLLRVPNSKLLRLWVRENTLRLKFGTREALVDAVAKLRSGTDTIDADYRAKALKLGTGRLLSLHKGLSRAAK
jgi:hypothetical protein